MPLFRNIRYRLHDWLLKKKVRRQSVDRYFSDLGTAKNIGILYFITDLSAIEIVENWKSKLEEQGKEVHALGYVEDKELKKKLARSGKVNYFTNKEVDWLLRPEGKKVDPFIQTEFDLLLNGYVQTCKPLQYISALSKAKLRVGAYKSASTLTFNDFLVDIGKGSDLTELIKQIEHYLKPQNANTYA